MYLGVKDKFNETDYNSNEFGFKLVLMKHLTSQMSIFLSEKLCLN